MRIVQINGDEGSRWKWFALPETDAAVELYAIDTTDLEALVAKANRDPDQAAQLMARKFFRDFKGMQDATGKDLENSEAVRLSLLRAAPDVRAFILAKLRDFAAWREEGNAGSGSAS